MGAAQEQQRERWEPGDLAECVHTGPWFAGGLVPGVEGPQHGEVRAVAFVGAGRHPLTGEFEALLRFDRYGVKLYASSVFRKIVPRPDPAERADERFCHDFGPGCRPARVGAGEGAR